MDAYPLVSVRHDIREHNLRGPVVISCETESMAKNLIRNKRAEGQYKNSVLLVVEVKEQVVGQYPN